ncbi:MAG TPA: ATP-binding protein [Gaiellaceae bacterium]|nr:ATP-binding protein [Gaiellaceae bacterium]
MSLSEHPPLPAPGEGRRFHWPFARFRDDTRRVLPVLVPVIVSGAVGLVLAVWWFVSTGPTWPDLAGIGVLLAAATVAEVFPVPIEGVAGNTSLATIFLVSVAAIYGWAAGGIVGFLTMVLAEAWRRPPFVRIAFNCALYVATAIAAGGAAAAVDDGTLVGLVVGAIAAAAAFYCVNMPLLAAVVSRQRQREFLPTLRSYVLLTFAPFAIMASLTVILVVLWDRSPFVAVVLVAPLLAIGFYQRWIHAALDRLREFDRLKDEFIAIVSHELRTPLTSVYGAAVTLREYELDDERRNALLEIVATESARLARLLDDILWVSRLDSGRADTFITRVETIALVSDVVDATRTHLPPTLSLELHQPAATTPVAADPDKLRQVLVNLIENAVKYSDEGRIEVRVEPQNGTMRFSVRDEGLGIPLEEHERIFDKFHRLDPNMRHGVGGTGLGLYICRELVERMEGRIWVDSEPGKGTTFSFELPLASSRS